MQRWILKEETTAWSRPKRMSPKVYVILDPHLGIDERPARLVIQHGQYDCTALGGAGYGPIIGAGRFAIDLRVPLWFRSPSAVRWCALGMSRLGADRK